MEASTAIFHSCANQSLFRPLRKTLVQSTRRESRGHNRNPSPYREIMPGRRRLRTTNISSESMFVQPSHRRTMLLVCSLSSAADLYTRADGSNSLSGFILGQDMRSSNGARHIWQIQWEVSAKVDVWSQVGRDGEGSASVLPGLQGDWAPLPLWKEGQNARSV